MQLLNNNVIVKFDESHNKKFNIGGIELVRPDTWVFDELSTGETQYQKQYDLRQTTPQIATIKVSNKRFNELKEGDRVFTHYLAFDTSEEIKIDEDNYRTIGLGSIFFKILSDEELWMMDDNYLGEEIFEEEEVTPSGIILTAFGAKKKRSTIKITHVPENSPYVKVGDVVYTIDDNQYTLDFLGKKYIKLNTWHIVAKA